MSDRGNEPGKNDNNREVENEPVHHLSALLFVAWLILQIIVSSLLVLLSGLILHSALNADVCSDVLNTSNTTTDLELRSSGENCALNIFPTFFSILAWIATTTDAAINLHYLIHLLSKKSKGEEDDCQDIKQPCNHCCKNEHYSFLARACYSWILMHAVLITVGANIYSWSWETSEVSIHLNTAMFCIACTGYLLLVAVFLGQGLLISCIARTEIPNQAQHSLCRKLRLPLLNTALVLSSTFCAAAVLVVFFNQGSELNYSSRIIVEIAYTIFTSIFWLVYCFIAAKKEHCRIFAACFVTIASLIALVVFITVYCVKDSHWLTQNGALLLLLFLFSLPVWLLPFFYLKSSQ